MLAGLTLRYPTPLRLRLQLIARPHLHYVTYVTVPVLPVRLGDC